MTGCSRSASTGTGLGVVVGQRSACAYMPVNKLRGGRRDSSPACTVGRHVPCELVKRKRAASGRLCVAMPAPNPAQSSSGKYACARGAGGLGGPLPVAQRGGNDRLVTGGHTTRFLWRWGLAIGLRLR